MAVFPPATGLSLVFIVFSLPISQVNLSDLAVPLLLPKLVQILQLFKPLVDGVRKLFGFISGKILSFFTPSFLGALPINLLIRLNFS
jgi:hypothetical protein